MEELSKESNENDCTKQKKQQKQSNRYHKLLCDLLLDFAKNTSLHGLRYVTERGLSAVEKTFWIITCLMSLCVCFWFMSNVWVKWQTSPIIVTLSEKRMSVTEVPFPAVTICPQSKIKQERYNYTDNMIKYYTMLWKTIESESGANSSDIERNIKQQNPSMKKLSNLGLICTDEDRYIDDDTIFRTDHTAVQDIQEVAPQLNEILWRAIWRNQGFPEDKLFDTVLTNEGVCFTFNSLAANEIFDMERIQTNYSYVNTSTPRKEWSLEGGYSSSSNDTYPRRGRANSAAPDLMLDLGECQDRDTLCDGFNRGFKVYLHHPADLPQSSLYYYAVPPGQVASFAIKVNVMKTSDTLIKYSPEIRQCYFHSEKKLRYFQVYTMNNCQLECSANYTIARCGCVWFHMPHNDSTALCEYVMYECVSDALEEYANDDAINASLCQCLPSCDSIQYEAEVVKTEYNALAFFKINDRLWKKIWQNLKKDNFNVFSYLDENYTEAYERLSTYSKIEMYFKEPRFVSMRRSELFGPTDFLANCGGLLGLFLGFSFLSLVEILYFFTLRLGCMFKRNNTVAEKKMDAGHIKNF